MRSFSSRSYVHATNLLDARFVLCVFSCMHSYSHSLDVITWSFIPLFLSSLSPFFFKGKRGSGQEIANLRIGYIFLRRRTENLLPANARGRYMSVTRINIYSSVSEEPIVIPNPSVNTARDIDLTRAGETTCPRSSIHGAQVWIARKTWTGFT